MKTLSTFELLLAFSGAFMVGFLVHSMIPVTPQDVSPYSPDYVSTKKSEDFVETSSYWLGPLTTTFIGCENKEAREYTLKRVLQFNEDEPFPSDVEKYEQFLTELRDEVHTKYGVYPQIHIVKYNLTEPFD